MSNTTFVNAKAVKWYTIDAKAVFLGQQQIWPAVKPSTTVTIPQGKVAHMQTRLANYNNYYDPDYDGIPVDSITAKAGDKIQIPALTGAGFDLAEVWIDVGSADPTDVPASDGGLQTRYGGGWTLPSNLAAGTYPIKIGQDVNSPMFDLINIVIH